MRIMGITSNYLWKNKQKESSEGIEIMENATVVYTDNVKEIFEAIRMIDKGVIIGRIIDGEFLDCGFISKGNIKKIKDGVKKKIPRMKA